MPAPCPQGRLRGTNFKKKVIKTAGSGASSANFCWSSFPPLLMISLISEAEHESGTRATCLYLRTKGSFLGRPWARRRLLLIDGAVSAEPGLLLRAFGAHKLSYSCGVVRDSDALDPHPLCLKPV